MASFFSYLPKIEYTPTRTQFQFTNQDFVLATNIFRKLSLDNSAYATDLFTELQVKDGIRPDQVSDAVYNDPNYDWVILLTNKIIDIKNDWPLSNAEFELLINKKYDDPHAVKHYLTKEVKNDLGEIMLPGGLEVYYDPSDPDSFQITYPKSYNPFVEETENGATLLTSISHYQWEQERNEKKRFLQILKPIFLETFVKVFKASAIYNPTDVDTNRTVKQTLNKTSIFNNITL
jgi:hypothetical protein|tara:strand:- start:469 stop:1167 length:699 start_codon:yes stop_codon:yes gene_type:complete